MKIPSHYSLSPGFYRRKAWDGRAHLRTLCFSVDSDGVAAYFKDGALQHHQVSDPNRPSISRPSVQVAQANDLYPCDRHGEPELYDLITTDNPRGTNMNSSNAFKIHPEAPAAPAPYPTKDFIGRDYVVVECAFHKPGETNEDTYKTSAHYNYKMSLDLLKYISGGSYDLLKGRVCVVDSAGPCRNYGLVTILSVVADRPENISQLRLARAWVVDVVNDQSHLDRAYRTEQRAFIMKRLEEVRQEQEAVDVYRALANNNPNMQKLLTQLDELEQPEATKEDNND